MLGKIEEVGCSATPENSTQIGLKLYRVPAAECLKDFLTVLIAQHNRTPPDNWNGVIPLSTK